MYGKVIVMKKKNIKIETAIRHLSDKGYDIDKSWLRDNKDRISIPRTERIPIVCKKCGYVKEVTISTASECKICCRQCNAQELLDKRFGAGHIKILEYGGSCENSKLYCIHSGQIFERRTNYMIHDDDAACVCRYHTWKEIKNEASSRGYEALDNHKDEDIIRTAEKFTLLCKKHNRTFETTFNKFHDMGHGCPECGRELQAERLRLTREEVQARIDEVHGKGRYVIGKDYKGISADCHIRCTLCGQERIVAPYVVCRGSHCSCKTESNGESFTSSFLDEMGLDYEKQVMFPECRYKKPLPFDFCVRSYDGTEFLIEFDGIQHFESVKNWGGEESLRKTQLRDRIKNEYCERNKIFLIRIQNRKDEFNPNDDKERAEKAFEKAGAIMAFFSELDREHPQVITVEI